MINISDDGNLASSKQAKDLPERKRLLLLLKALKLAWTPEGVSGLMLPFWEFYFEQCC